MSDHPKQVLFVCRHNQARSLMAETLLNMLGRRHFQAWSAGLDPADAVHPLALDTIRKAGLAPDPSPPKGVDAFLGADAPRLDFVFTVCEEVVDSLPDFPGHPVVAAWPIPDPNAKERANKVEQAAAFAEAFKLIRRRIELLVSLPMSGLDRLSLQSRVDEIGTVG